MQGVDPAVPPSGPGCADCDAADPQGWWFHLRRCAECGRIGCCDSSPGQHASAHAAASGHRIVRSFEPGEEWFWDYEEETMYESGPTLAAPEHHPLTQSAPGPAERLPEDWPQHLHR
ncbi:MULTISPECIES: UBP-type zinc finger domain-containing protein [unclassified Amycolatopsis]|uniref:UBP-type zinc finger domain-containing protein n=1 Tax=unclassified Amycolatopsis TaxID=2618356 RepID=UPI001FF490EB|nr:UBP-type zinc finger domain-containing protein [Amycolatopsis sp. FBCC-B4732]UOX91044.1 UBP-type zinc finger domain-containing protein [Amycolatopsis sp. FBCC-B4732]